MVSERKMSSGMTQRIELVHNAFVQRRQGFACKNSKVVGMHIKIELWGLSCTCPYVLIISIMSVFLTLRERVVVASKVSFFFRIWKLWFQQSDHSEGRNTKNLTL